MGLDMTLSAKKHVNTFMEPQQYNALKNAIDRELVSTPIPLDHRDTLQSLEISVKVAYWRKANQIHGWFVNNVQDGVDECRESYVSLEVLTELRDICRHLLAKKKELEDDTGDEVLNHGTLVGYCMATLPPVEGFFFGSYDIDQWYWDDIRNTVEMLTPIIKWANAEKADKSYWEFSYRASW